MDRFDLEQNIMRAWNIVEDLKECENMEEVKVIREYYSQRFEKLWNTFEEVVSSYAFVKRDESGSGTDVF